MRQRFAVVMLVAIPLLGCGATTTSPSSQPQHVAVTIKNFSFGPSSLDVQRGSTVAFTNTDAATHTVAADDHSFDSGALAQGAGFTHTFAGDGTFAYHCAIHQYMTGTVTVTG